ncbi:MAG: DUF3011 domain-containing protein [Thermoanaerobaculia bacterium]
MIDRKLALSILVLSLMASARPAEAASPDEVRACSDAVRAMIRANTDIRTGSAGLGASGRSSIAGGETIPWSSVGGHEGVCRIDSQGRLQEIEISRFPAVGGGGGSFTPYYVSCSSEDARLRECPLQAPGRVELARRESRADCVEGFSWGYSPNSVWVDRGCRAVFRVSPVAGSGGGWGSNEPERARAACLDRARREGLRVSRITATSDRGSAIDVLMQLERTGILTEIACRYDKRTGSTYWLNR